MAQPGVPDRLRHGERRPFAGVSGASARNPGCWCSPWLNLALFVLLLGYTIDTGPASTWVTLIAVLVLSFVFEIVYRKRVLAVPWRWWRHRRRRTRVSS